MLDAVIGPQYLVKAMQVNYLSDPSMRVITGKTFMVRRMPILGSYYQIKQIQNLIDHRNYLVSLLNCQRSSG
jgi:hypothetical protein